jgi:hypothetical protein
MGGAEGHDGNRDDGSYRGRGSDRHERAEMPEMPEVCFVLEVQPVSRLPGSPGTAGQLDMFYGGALHRGRRAGRPQGRQQQRRLAQGLPAALLPVRAVGVRRDRAQFSDEGGRISGPDPGVLGQAGRDQRPQRLGHRLQRYRVGAVLGQQRLGGLPGERRAAGQALIEGCRGRVDIPGRAGRGPAELLRRRIGQGPAGSGRSPARAAMPKSVSLLAPSALTSTFSGL